MAEVIYLEIGMIEARCPLLENVRYGVDLHVDLDVAERWVIFGDIFLSGATIGAFQRQVRL